MLNVVIPSVVTSNLTLDVLCYESGRVILSLPCTVNGFPFQKVLVQFFSVKIPQWETPSTLLDLKSCNLLSANKESFSLLQNK